jgi:hypothetical protein
MERELKDLLIKDITARLSYGVKCKILETNETKILASVNYDRDNTLFDFWEDERKIQYDYQLYLSEFKPYLYPLSSMTEEQRNEYHELLYNPKHGIDIDYFDWCHKNHLDCRGLIEKGLALDATGLNIYL